MAKKKLNKKFINKRNKMLKEAKKIYIKSKKKKKWTNCMKEAAKKI